MAPRTTHRNDSTRRTRGGRATGALALLVALTWTLGDPSSAEAGRRWNAVQRRVNKVIGKKPTPKLVTPEAGNLQVAVGRRPVWAAFGKNDAKNPAVKKASRALGTYIARFGFDLATGGGKGLPKDTETGAFFAGADTIAFTPKGKLDDHSRSHDGDIGQTTHLVLTGTGGGSGTIAREGPMAEAADIGSYANGGSGTFGELMALLHNERGVVALMKGTGGVADAAEAWMRGGWLGAKPTFRVVADHRPKELVRQAERALDELGPRPITASKALISPGRPKQVLFRKDKAGRVVASFLLADARASAADRAAHKELVGRWVSASAELAAEGTTVVMPSEPTSGARSGLADVAARAGARTIEISPEQAPAGAIAGARDRRTGREIPPMTAAGGRRVSFLGYGGREPGRFAAAREVTQDADVVFLGSAHYQNLSGLAYALRDDRRPLLAVLASESTFGDKLPEMIQVIDASAHRSRLVVASTPAALIAKVKAELRGRRKAIDASDDQGAGLD